MNDTQTQMTFHYVVDWENAKVNTMTIEPDGDMFVAVAHNPRGSGSMVMSNPRNFEDTLYWVRNYCDNFCFLPT
jgi:hypothetical protein